LLGYSEVVHATTTALVSRMLQLRLRRGFTSLNSESVVRMANQGPCNWHATSHNTYATSRPIGWTQTAARCGQTTCDWEPITWSLGFTLGFLNMKRPSLPRITCCLSSGPPRLEEHTGGMGDYAIGWKRPSKSPTIPHPKTLWLGGDAHPFPSKSPSIPIQSPSKTRLDGQSAGRDDGRVP